MCSGSLTDPLASAVTVLGGETYDDAGKTVRADQAGWFTLACAGSAAAKMKLMGYAPQTEFDGSGAPSTVAQRQATLKTADLPAELLRRLMLRALAAVAAEPFTPRGNQLVATIKALARGEQTMLGTVLIRPDRQDPSHWHFRRAPPPRQRGDAGRDDGQGEQN